MARALWLLVAASLVVALAAVLWFTLATTLVRLPYWGESEVIFEASRLRDHYPLFTDPTVGAIEYGDPPSRFFVTYPPVFTWFVSLVPAASALVVSRFVSTLAWFGTLAAIAWRSRRRETAGAAMFVAGIWVLANFATVGRPDSVAGAVAAFALWRATGRRRARLDPLTIALFVLVPWIKPTMIGLPIGALLASRDRRTLAIAAALAFASVGIAHVASSGALFRHVINSNAQPFTLAQWLDQVPARLPFFAPLFVWACWVGRKERIGLGALVGAIVWTLIALAKTGSASNYWMEPCLAAVILIARAPARNYDDWRIAAFALASVLWADVASVRGSIEHAARYRADAQIVASIRSRKDCPGIIGSDEAGIELALNGRILTTTYQMMHLLQRGRLPLAPFRALPHCYVEHTRQLELVPELERNLRDHRLVEESSGFRLWVSAVEGD